MIYDMHTYYPTIYIPDALMKPLSLVSAVGSSNQSRLDL